jgi:hypothetical protein
MQRALSWLEQAALPFQIKVAVAQIRRPRREGFFLRSTASFTGRTACWRRRGSSPRITSLASPESVLDGEVGWSRDTRRALLREDGFSNGTEEWDLRLAGLRSKPSLLERDTHPTVNH